MNAAGRAPISVVTGASSGIGRELAHVAAAKGHRLLIVADEVEIEQVAAELTTPTSEVRALVADLSTGHGVDALVSAIGDRPVELLMANAGRVLGGPFLDSDFPESKNLVDLNVSGTISLIHSVGSAMRQRGEGRILITGSIAGFVPGSHMAVYNATKAFLDSFSYALRDELRDTGVSVTCMMPGITDTRVFERGGMENTPAGDTDLKDDPARVAREGYDALMAGRAGVVTGNVGNKIQAALAGVVPAPMLARFNRLLAEE